MNETIFVVSAAVTNAYTPVEHSIVIAFSLQAMFASTSSIVAPVVDLLRCSVRQTHSRIAATSWGSEGANFLDEMLALHPTETVHPGLRSTAHIMLG